ncbi:claspin-like [Uranotaenia lowii]|uniref:claspin-like n=1 Tax=Uranotaenia lowii TaxID=190385 RepID=UPI00247AC7AD|nr:claspin-like [Uranotaenia lowii]
MDQYPYNIAPNFQYPDGSVEKPSDIVSENTSTLTPLVPPDGSAYYLPGPPTYVYDATLQQHPHLHNPMPANGLIAPLEPVPRDVYTPYNNVVTPQHTALEPVPISNVPYPVQPESVPLMVSPAPIETAVPPADAYQLGPPVDQVAVAVATESFSAPEQPVASQVPEYGSAPAANDHVEDDTHQPQESTSVPEQESLPTSTPDTPIPDKPIPDTPTTDVPISATEAPISSTDPIENQESSNIDTDLPEAAPTEEPSVVDSIPVTVDASTENVEESSETIAKRPVTAVEEPISGGICKKKRRRILLMNDDDDDSDDAEMDRLELLRSPEPPEPENEDKRDGEATTEEGDEDGKEVGEGVDDEERPGSAGSTTATASLLQNVVMIPAGDSDAHKRKKIRVLDSDDEDETANNVDDIGLMGEDDELNPGGLMMDENAEDGDYGAMEGIELDKMEQIVTMDAPIIDPSLMEGEDDAASEEGEENKSDAGEDAESHHEDEDRQSGSEKGDEERSNASEAGDAAEDEEVEEEEEETAEEGVELITAENDEGEAIGLATDDEQDMEEEEPPAEENQAEAPADENQADTPAEESDQEAQESDAAAERSRSEAEESEEEQQSASEKEDESENEKDQSESRSAASSPVDNDDQNSQDSIASNQKKSNAKSDDEIVCQNDLDLKTISLLTDEEDDITTPLPPPKKELPVVRIVNIKKELLDDRFAKRESSHSYQQQHYLKQQQMAQKQKQKKKRKERTFDNNDPFGAWSSSSSEDEFIPNDIYFGTTDRVFTSSTKARCQRDKMLEERYYAKYGNKYSKYQKQRYTAEPTPEELKWRKGIMEEVSRLNIPSYQQQQLENMINKRKKKKRDRFYDRSQEIPNDIYFNNINVPLHILHAFGSSSSDDERSDARTGSNRPSSGYPGHMKSSSSSSSVKVKYSSGRRPGRPPKSASSDYSRSSVSPSSDRSIQAMKEYLKIAGFKKVKFHKLWEGCKSNQERANAILQLMQEKGLEGEPTVAKCRELRKQLQMEREVNTLDTSLIIDSGEGRITRRSLRNPRPAKNPDDPDAPSTSGTSQPPEVPPECQETLNRIRNVIDPDSDGE